MKPAIFAIVLVAALLAGGCQTTRTRTVPQVVERRLEVPPSLLQCLPEPVAAQAWRTQRDVALYLVRLAAAGEDCRARLDAVRKLLEGAAPPSPTPAPSPHTP